MASNVVKTISRTVHELSTLKSSIIMDGVQDISGSEQEASVMQMVTFYHMKTV